MSRLYSEVGPDSLTTPSMQAVAGQTSCAEIRVGVAKSVPSVEPFELFLIQFPETVFGLIAHSPPKDWSAVG